MADDIPLVRWLSTGGGGWMLVVGRGKKPRKVANVWANGVWHTWDRSGIGGENSSEPTIERAKVEAAASVIAQGFI